MFFDENRDEKAKIVVGVDEKGAKYHAVISNVPYAHDYETVKFMVYEPDGSQHKIGQIEDFNSSYILGNHTQVVFNGGNALWGNGYVPYHIEMLDEVETSVHNNLNTSRMLWNSVCDPILNPEYAERVQNLSQQV